MHFVKYHVFQLLVIRRTVVDVSLQRLAVQSRIQDVLALVIEPVTRQLLADVTHLIRKVVGWPIYLKLKSHVHAMAMDTGTIFQITKANFSTVTLLPN